MSSDLVMLDKYVLDNPLDSSNSTKCICRQELTDIPYSGLQLYEIFVNSYFTIATGDIYPKALVGLTPGDLYSYSNVPISSSWTPSNFGNTFDAYCIRLYRRDLDPIDDYFNLEDGDPYQATRSVSSIPNSGGLLLKVMDERAGGIVRGSVIVDPVRIGTALSIGYEWINLNPVVKFTTPVQGNYAYIRVQDVMGDPSILPSVTMLSTQGWIELTKTQKYETNRDSGYVYSMPTNYMWTHNVVKIEYNDRIQLLKLPATVNGFKPMLSFGGTTVYPFCYLVVLDDTL